jgi:deoxycytidine triphosphate deaminase
MISGYEIHQEWINGNIAIHPYNPANIQPNSYDLTLGDQLKVCRPNAHNSYIDTDLPGEGDIVDLIDGHFIIYPGEVYIGHTVEMVGSSTYAPILHGRSSLARHGLAVHITAGFGDVGWYGQFVLEIVNHIPCPIMIRPGRRVCQVSWEPVTGKVYPYESGYQNQEGCRLSKGIL